MPKKEPEVIRVEIANWTKYHTDKNGELIDTSKFFRVQKKMMFNPKIQQLSATQFRLYLLLMCTSVDGKVQCMGSVLRALCAIRHVSLSEHLSKLTELGLIFPLEEKERREIREEKRREIKENDFELLKTNAKKPKAYKTPESELERLYGKYPRKMGKTKGLEKLRKILKSEDDLAEFEKAIDCFAELTAKQKPDPQFIPHFSTFVNSQWRDYLDEDVGRVGGTEAELRQQEIYRAAWGLDE